MHVNCRLDAARQILGASHAGHNHFLFEWNSAMLPYTQRHGGVLQRDRARAVTV